jgi:dTDP-4-amino-4,6-dideoxygalactose transaminase
MAISKVELYEREFARWLGVKRAFAFWKGRVALYAILQALEIAPSDEVIVPGYTCVMDVNPIKYLGAKPVYVDIEPQTYNINTELIEGKITPKTKVIIAQHTYGYPCQLDIILDIAARYKINVIEDCCLSVGSKYKGQTVGTFGETAYYSFQWNKPFTCGLGGMVVTNDDIFAEKMISLRRKLLSKPSIKEVLMLAAELAVYRTIVYPRTTAWAQSLFRELTKKGVVIGSAANDEFVPKIPDGFFKGMGPIQAMSGLNQIKKIERNISHREIIANLYDELLSERDWKPRQFDKSIMRPIMVRYPVRVSNKNKALEDAAKAGVELGSWFECPLHPIETPLEMYDYELGMCPEAEKASREVVNLPLHPRVSRRTAERNVEFICRFDKSEK